MTICFSLQEIFDVVAYAPAEEINLEALRESLIQQGLYNPCKLPDGNRNFYSILKMPHVQLIFYQIDHLEMVQFIDISFRFIFSI